MVNINRCPNCKESVARAVTRCGKCGSEWTVAATPSSASGPDNAQQGLLLFWVLAALFVSAVAGGLYMLVPHMLK